MPTANCDVLTGTPTEAALNGSIGELLTGDTRETND
jgi:hypothetical protein